jgi:aromatic-L-amino-acid decarboxylase
MATNQLATNGVSEGQHKSDMDPRTLPPMGMTGQTFLEAATSAVNDIERYYSTLQERPVVPSISPGYLNQLLPTEAPQQGERWDAIAKDIETKIMPGVTHWQSPKSWVRCGVLR